MRSYKECYSLLLIPAGCDRRFECMCECLARVKDCTDCDTETVYTANFHTLCLKLSELKKPVVSQISSVEMSQVWVYIYSVAYCCLVRSTWHSATYNPIEWSDFITFEGCEPHTSLEGTTLCISSVYLDSFRVFTTSRACSITTVGVTSTSSMSSNVSTTATEIQEDAAAA